MVGIFENKLKFKLKTDEARIMNEIKFKIKFKTKLNIKLINKINLLM